MTEHIPEFLVGATNVYRTRGYIVKQCVAFSYDEVYGTYLMSRDTYYRCTPKRDREFEAAFADRKNVNGKHIPTAMYARAYCHIFLWIVVFFSRFLWRGLFFDTGKRIFSAITIYILGV